jgi:HEPN domain-containing protein
MPGNPFERDTSHWLMKLSPDEWLRAALGELRRAEEAYKGRDPRAGLAGARRAAGMALNGALIAEPNAAWGRSYVDHLLALSREDSAPARVREAAKLLVETPLPGQGSLVSIRTASSDEKVLEAARDVAAHAYAVVTRHGAHGAGEEQGS